MKKNIIIAAIILSSVSLALAQKAENLNFPMLGEVAPSFAAESTTGTINFPEDYRDRWKILFSHPADFTPVCTSEILELAAAQEDFNDHQASIVVVSVDKLENHREWIKSMESLKYKDHDFARIKFPLVSDSSLAIAKKYGMIQPSMSSTRDVRGVFIIDPKNKIRAMFFYPMDIGRNLGEIERTLVALQTADKQKVLIPANWQPGGDVLLPYVRTSEEAEKLNVPDNDEYYQLNWYMKFKRGDK
jgi:peroxiredoxin 2/4